MKSLSHLILKSRRQITDMWYLNAFHLAYPNISALVIRQSKMLTGENCISQTLIVKNHLN